MATISEFETNPNEYGSNYSKKSHLIIWDLKTGSSVHNSFEKSNISYTSFSKDSSRILIFSFPGSAWECMPGGSAAYTNV